MEDKMVKYAANDVFYLNKVYIMFEKNLRQNRYKNLTYSEIFDACQNLLIYPRLNLKIKNYNKHLIPVKSEVDGLLKYIHS